MKIDIGPYPSWFGPYQFARLLKYVGVSNKTCDIIAEKYIPAAPFLWLEKLKGQRKVKINIDRYDAWGADHTLALIIPPLLRRVKEDKHGVPGDFLGEEYNKLVSSSEYWNEKGGGPLHVRAEILFEEGKKKWNDTLDHIIWAFEQYADEEWDEQFWSGEHGDMEFIPTGKLYPNPETGEMEETYQLGSGGTRVCDWDARQKHWDRMQEGINLFAKYYTSFWT